jgi:hypothetical protein
MTLAQILEAKLQTAKEEVAKIEADIATLGSTSWFQQEESVIKAWLQAAAKHLGL